MAFLAACSMFQLFPIVHEVSEAGFYLYLFYCTFALDGYVGSKYGTGMYCLRQKMPVRMGQFSL